MFVADDLMAWLTGMLADRGYRRLTTILIGTDQERALRAAATAAVRQTARELRPDNAEQAENLALVISQVFSQPVPLAPLAEHRTVLEALQEGLAGQLAVLDNASLTGTGQSSADLLSVPGTVVAEKLTSHLMREIVGRGALGGPLFPLASQLNDDVTHLQGQQIRSEVRQLGGEIQEAVAKLDRATHIAAAVPTALAQLPAPVTGFTARGDELDVLTGLLDPANSAKPALVSAVAGLAGVGKTALVVQAGHAAVARGWFSGGVLFIDLHGYDEAPVEPAQALDALLRALGVPAEHIPPSAEERAALYRSSLAESPEPVMVIADNASTEAQVRPLLPGCGRHRVLVTSRDTLAGLGARLVDVTNLDEHAALKLLETALRSARPDDDRIGIDQESAARLAQACGGLPLALQIVAALLKADPVMSTAELADQLWSEGRLETLRYDDGSGTAGSSVAAAFGLSYRRLADTAARMFRLLAVCPGPDVCAPATAALTDMPISDARKVLGTLARSHLIEPAPAKAGRWKMHDLVHLYASKLSSARAEEDRREQARDRLLDYYVRMSDAADDYLRALPGTTLPTAFTSQKDALDWLDVERPSLVAAVSMAANTGRDQAALNLSLILAQYLAERRRFDDALTTAAIGLTAAQRLGDRRTEGMALNNLGDALKRVQRFEEAITTFHEAVRAYHDTGDQYHEAMVLDNLGTPLREVGRVEEAIAAHKHAATIFRQAGDLHSTGMALNNQGSALAAAGRFEDAITIYQNAVAIYRQTGDRRREARTLANASVALRKTERFEDAIDACLQAATVFREINDRHGEGQALTNLGRPRGEGPVRRGDHRPPGRRPHLPRGGRRAQPRDRFEQPPGREGGPALTRAASMG